MDRLLDSLMLHDNNVIDGNFYTLPDILDMTTENPIINFDAGKKDSYLFYVEAPYQEEIGYREDLKVFFIKANPYVEKYDIISGKKYNENNNVDGDTMYFILDSIVDTHTAFSIGNKDYSSFKAFLETNDQDKLIVRILGINAPEVPHYIEVPMTKEDEAKYIIEELFSVAVNNQELYRLHTFDREPNQKIKFFKGDESYHEIVSSSVDYDDSSITYYRMVYYNDTLGKSEAYVNEGLACKEALIDLLTRAVDIRLVLDQQSLNRKPSDYSSPYDKVPMLTEEGFLTGTFAQIDALWHEYFGHVKYAYRSYNAPGLDTYGRSLGEIYVKIYVEELQEIVWVNAAKYILFHYDTYTEAVPSYTSNPTEVMHNSFMSSVFKLSTYDKRYKDVIDGFTHATAEILDERNQWYSKITGIDIDHIREYNVIIGDTVLAIPPINIRSVTETNHTKVPLLRSKGAIVSSLPRSQKILELDLFFNNDSGINGSPYEFTGKNGATHTYYMNGLRSLIAQFKLTPFLPIENNYINDSLMVEAVTLVNINVQTMPNYPKCIKATLTLAEFNYLIFMPELPSNGLHNAFSQAIHYPAMRWYYQRLLTAGEAIKHLEFNSEAYLKKAYGSRTALVPMNFKDSRVSFYIPDRSQLQTRLEIMSDPYPVMTQEQLTEEMLVGVKRLGPLINNVRQIANNDAFVNSLKELFALHSFNATSEVFASQNLETEATWIHENVPLYTVIQQGDRMPLLPAYDDMSVVFKTFVKRENGKVTVPYYTFYHEHTQIRELEITLVSDVKKAFQAQLGLFGETDVFTRCDGDYLYIGAVTPLPAELVQSSYELRLIARKIATTFGLDDSEVDNILQYTPSGSIGVPIELRFKINAFGEVGESDQKAYFVEMSEKFFSLYADGVGIRTLDYLYAISAEEIDSALGDSVEQSIIDEKRDIVDNEAMGLRFDKYSPGDLLVEQIAINYNNTFSNMTLNMVDGKAFQYCGAQDINLQISLVTNSEYVVQSLTHLPEISAEYARLYRKVLNCWPLRIDCELTKLFGILEVLIENVQTETIPNQPGYTRLTMSLSSVDRTVRQREALSRIDTEASNATYINYGNKGSAEVKSYFDLKHSLAKAEVYPDLELPTVDELHEAGFELYRNKDYNINKAQRLYVDPDFYFIYGQALACEIFRDNFLNAFDTDISYDLTDMEGAYTRFVRKKAANGYTEQQTLENDIAVAQKDFYDHFNKQGLNYDYQDMSKEIYKALGTQSKNTFALAQTLAELGTSFWHIGEEAKIAFAESSVEFMPSTVTASYEAKKQDMIKAIDTFLNVPIEENMPNAYSQTVESDLSAKEQRDAFYTIVKSICHDLTQMTITKDISLATSHYSSFTQQESLVITSYHEHLAGVLCAYADTYSGEGYYTNQLENAEANNTAYWKAKQFLSVTDDETVIPFARVERDGFIYAQSLEDAITNGVSFGPFNIEMRRAETLVALHGEKVKYIQADKRLFLDPYYLQLQLDNNKDAIKAHKNKLMTLTGYGTIAFFRELLFMYRHYLKEGKLLSLYEITRMEAEKAYDDKQYITAEQMVHDTTRLIDREQAEIINDYTRVLKGLSNEYLTEEEREALAYNTLNQEKDSILWNAIVDVGGAGFFGLADLFSDIKNESAKSMSELEEMFEELYTASLLESDAEEKQTRYFYLKEVCKNHQDVDVLTFAQNLQELMNEFEFDNNFSANHAVAAINQIKDDEEKLFIGRFLSMAMTLIEPQTIMPLINTKDADALNLMVTNASRPDTSMEYSRLRKFLYALDGRDVITLASVGNIPITLETEYRNYITERVLIERSNQPELYLRDSFYDMIKYDKRGRMLRAFPTYYMFFIDEGREIGLWKLHDNFYSSTAIAEIEIVKSRKVAADTAHIVLSNLFNSYTQDDKDFIYDLDNPYYETSIRYKVQDAFNALFSPRTYFNQQEIERLNTPEPLTARLTPGTRMHIRMGYGSNASELPIVFNGKIAEIGNGSVCEIVAQGDGVELLNPIQDIQDAADIQYQDKFAIDRFFDSWLTNGTSAKTILASILTSRGYWGDQKKEDLTNGYLKAVNPYGITHFGDSFFNSIFKDGECVQNLFEVYSAAPYEVTEEQRESSIGLEKHYKTAQVPQISIDVLNKNTWEIGHICASVAPDYKFAIVPFELRSSIFMGRGRDYYAYAYEKINSIEENNTYIREKRKPFEQYHYYTSYSDIINNTIVANSMNVKTNAVGLYQQTGSWGKVKPKETSRLYVDFDIFSENQTATTVDTQLWAQGMPILGNGFFLGINADTDDDVDDLVPGAAEIAWRMTASALKQSMKDMYEGELTVMGDPSVKPHDRMLITDLYEEMQGGAWVEAVVHSFNAQTGFTTSLYADCISEIDDRMERQNDMMTKNATAKAAAAYLGQATINQLFYSKGLKRLNNTIAELMIKGGLKLQPNMAVLYDSLKAAGQEIPTQYHINLLDEMIKSSNGFSTLNFSNGFSAAKLSVKDKQSLKTIVANTTKAFFAGTGEALTNVLLNPFLELDSKLDVSSVVSTARDLGKLLTTSANHLEKATGDYLIDALTLSNNAHMTPEQLKTYKDQAALYDDLFNGAIKDVYVLNDEVIDGLDKLAQQVLLSDSPDEIKEYAKTLRALKTNKDITDVRKLKEVGTAITECAKISTDTNLLKAIGDSFDNIRDISKLSDLSKGIKNYLPAIDNVIALAGAATGPIGVIGTILYTALEMGITYTMGAYATEFIERHLQNLQVMRIYPLTKNGRVMTAGLTGHKGLVVGSPTEDTQGAWTEWVTNLFGNKQPDNLLSHVFQFLFVSDKAREIASRYRTYNQVPDVLTSGYDYAELQAQFDANYNTRLSKITNQNKLFALSYDRYENEEEAASYYHLYTAKSYTDGLDIDEKTQKDFVLIEKYQPLANYQDQGVLQIIHNLLKEEVAHLTFDYVKEPVFALIEEHEDDLLNVPMLREETLIVLDMLIAKYVTLLGLANPTTDQPERIEDNQLILTSATIIDSEGYDGTGYAFHITSLNIDVLEQACYELVDELNHKKPYTITLAENMDDFILYLGIPKP